MHTDESILPSSRKIKFISAGLPCLLGLYVLSIGPVCKLEDHGRFSEQTNKVVGVIYAPLSLLDVVPGADKFFNWYIFHLWNCDNGGDITL
jgi:hypothetical protein